jgi:D-glycero-D-manno-heptose 1,7-bisphosphate phosphatase
VKKAVFIDRDGTLNEMVYDETHGLMDSPRRPEQVRAIPGAGAFLHSVREMGYLAIVVTNQPGLAKGTFTEEELESVNRELARQLAAEGGAWDDLRYCPHHPDGGATPNLKYVRTCDCRKPKPGLLTAAAAEHGIDLSASWMIGDGVNDVQAGRRAGCRTVLVTNLKVEHIEKFIGFQDAMPATVAASLEDVLVLIRGKA